MLCPMYTSIESGDPCIRIEDDDEREGIAFEIKTIATTAAPKKSNKGEAFTNILHAKRLGVSNSMSGDKSYVKDTTRPP